MPLEITIAGCGAHCAAAPNSPARSCFLFVRQRAEAL